MPSHDTFTVKVPGSTSNLGAGFDCFGLALKLYLTVRVTRFPDDAAETFRIVVAEGPESRSIPTTADNLILRTALSTATSFGSKLPNLQFEIENEIPLGRGLGSSAAAIVAGVAIAARSCSVRLAPDELIARGTEIEGHADNIAASVLGGRVVCYESSEGKGRAVRLAWPDRIRVIVVSPEIELATQKARAVLPDSISRADAVFNLQRSALLTAALDHGFDDQIWEAMQDRLHQPYRADLIPGLGGALATPQIPGLLGLALSGAGPSIVAFAKANFDVIGEAIAAPFRAENIATTVRVIEVNDTGVSTI